MTQASEDLDLLRHAAVEAGEIALEYFGRDPKTWWKEGNSPVSEADFAVDDYLKATLIGARPDYGWVSEEMEREDERTASFERFFVVDPIDGTRAYLRGETTWCVSIAVIEAGRPIAGIVHAAALGETFTAVAGGPACLNGEPISVSRPAASAGLRLAAPKSLCKRLNEKCGSEVATENWIPSLAYRLALVACGRLDATLVRPSANDWDIAAADLVIERAGGILCGREGEPALYTSAGRRHGLLMAASRNAYPRVSALAEGIFD